MTWLKPFAFLSALAAGPVCAQDLVVFAAASLKGPLDAIVAEMPAVTVSYAGSGTLARQVQQGAPADVVLLASDLWIDALRESDHIATPQAFAANRLVLVGPPGAELIDLTAEAVLATLDGGRLAMGFAGAVPAGIFAKEAMTSLGLWEALSSHVAEVDNVRAALALVARGEAPLGAVYATDPQVVPGLTIAAVFPAESHGPIAYWAAQVSGSAHPAAAEFVAAMSDADAQMILAEAGFCAPTGPCEVP